MSMINKGIPYFPISANFFEEEVMELVRSQIWNISFLYRLEITV